MEIIIILIIISFLIPVIRLIDIIFKVNKVESEKLAYIEINKIISESVAFVYDNEYVPNLQTASHIAEYVNMMLTKSQIKHLNRRFPNHMTYISSKVISTMMENDNYIY